MVHSLELTIREPSEPAKPLRKFLVEGEDVDGFIHSFHTDDSEQAETIAGILAGDLVNVRTAAAADEPPS